MKSRRSMSPTQKGGHFTRLALPSLEPTHNVDHCFENKSRKIFKVVELQPDPCVEVPDFHFLRPEVYRREEP